MSEIDFSTPKRKCIALEQSMTSTTTEPTKGVNKQPCPKQTTDDFYNMLQEINDTGYKSVILSVVPRFSDAFIPKEKLLRQPLDLCSYFQEENLTAGLDELILLGKSIDLSLTNEVVLQVEKSSKKQAESKKWFTYRAGRITASRFKAVCHTKTSTSAPSLVKAICYPSLLKFSSRATEWRCQHEKDAIAAYKKSVSSEHINLRVEDVGLFINPEYPHFGATPDAKVRCDCCGTGCVEVKCPFCIKDTNIQDNANLVSCLELQEDGSLKLSSKHSYYYQLQAQIFISRMAFCDFVVWAPQGEPHIERVTGNSDFWEKESAKATHFFQEAVLPELLGHYFTRNTENEEQSAEQFQVQEASEPGSSSQWCTCKKDLGGKMIMCENSGCIILWYHTKCLGLKRVPKGKWMCAKCKSKKKKDGIYPK